VKKRKELVRRFQDDEAISFFVLSLKAGGAGLNLTAASHVIHFDRWWNPAVENQATDRAFRIGQTKNVLVHKFVCRGTVEDKIDQMIESKQQFAGNFLSGAAALPLTEMKDAELLRLVSLARPPAQEAGRADRIGRNDSCRNRRASWGVRRGTRVAGGRCTTGDTEYEWGKHWFGWGSARSRSGSRQWFWGSSSNRQGRRQARQTSDCAPSARASPFSGRSTRKFSGSGHR
jgi:hypothetical protein